jgi:hypothetical protein
MVSQHLNQSKKASRLRMEITISQVKGRTLKRQITRIHHLNNLVLTVSLLKIARPPRQGLVSRKVASQIHTSRLSKTCRMPWPRHSTTIWAKKVIVSQTRLIRPLMEPHASNILMS